MRSALVAALPLFAACTSEAPSPAPDPPVGTSPATGLTNAAADGAPEASGVIDGGVAGVVSGEPGKMSVDLEDVDSEFGSAVGVLTVDGATAARSIGANKARAGWKLLAVDVQITVVTSGQGNLFKSAFRLEADDEWYPPLNSLNEVLSLGSVYNGTLYFEVPEAASTFIFEGGSPAGSSGGLSTRFDISLPEG